jgi:phage terminase small subunit
MPSLQYAPHEVFAQHYTCNGYNSHKAAAAAGLHPSAKNHPAVKARIAELMQIQFAALQIDALRVKEELARVAFGDVRGLFDEQGNLRHITDLDDDTAATISAVDVELKSNGPDQAPTTVVKVRRHDKMAALKILAQHFKIIGEDNDGVNQLANALADRLNAAKRRMLTPQEVEDATILDARGGESTEPESLQPTDLTPPARYTSLLPAPADHGGDLW